MSLKVILDTNFLVIPAKFGIDIFAETETVLERKIVFIVLDSVITEIEKKIQNSHQQSARRQFKVARELIKRCTIASVPKQLYNLPVDDQLLSYTKMVDGILATNDRNLRRHARDEQIPVLFLRGKKRLVLEGHLA